MIPSDEPTKPTDPAPMGAPQPLPTTGATPAGGIPKVSPPIVNETPMQWRLGIAGGVLLLALLAWGLSGVTGPRGQAFFGVFCFFGLVAMFSTNLRAVKWKTIAWGVGLQVVLALLVIKVGFVNDALHVAKDIVNKFIEFADAGAYFVFGNLSEFHPTDKPPFGPFALNPGYNFKFLFAFRVLPPILFISAFFTVLYHYGVLQLIVRAFAKFMVYLMGTSGAETLSVAANVFMGQTEAPLIVKPYVPRMTNSELFTLMASGMAHISGGMMVIYISYGADPVAVLTTCIMACPCSLYLSKLFMPETTVPETAGEVKADDQKSPHVNGIDAAAAGTGDGLRLALNVAAMLIVFIAFVAMFNGILSFISEGLTLQLIFSKLFSPVAFLMGVEAKDVPHVAELLGLKLAMNEHVAYLTMKGWKATPDFMSARSYTLAAFALTGFANFASVGIQIGGIGAMAPERRSDLARLGMRALFVGFTATLLNAAIAGIFLAA